MSQQIFTVGQLVRRLNIEDGHIILIGDGSGSIWARAGGWACVLINRLTQKRKLFYGSLNVANTQITELWPYLHAIEWFVGVKTEGPKFRKQLAQRGELVTIDIITDNRAVALAGNTPDYRKKYRTSWAMIDALSNSYRVRWHHVPRNVVHMNILVDEIARQARLKAKGVENDALAVLARRYKGFPQEATIYDVLPESFPEGMTDVVV